MLIDIINNRKWACLAILFSFALFVTSCKKDNPRLNPVDNTIPGSVEGLLLEPGDSKVTAYLDKFKDTDVDYIEVRYIDPNIEENEGLVTRRYARDREKIDIFNLQNFYEYTFKFIVVDDYGNRSDSISATSTPIAEINDIFAKGGDTEGSIVVVWQDPEDKYDAFSSIVFYDENGNKIGEANKGDQTIKFSNFSAAQEVKITAKIITKLGTVSKGVEFTAKARAILPPPSEVSEISVTPKTSLLEISWLNPDEENFYRTEIWWGQGQDASDAKTQFLGKIDTLDDGRNRILLNKLTNDINYVVVIKTSDEQGNTSEGMKIVSAPVNTVFTGNVVIKSQADADAFDSKYTYILGNLSIDGAGSTLTNLANFKNLDSIAGQFLYKGSTYSYIDINDFENLQSIGGIFQVESVYSGGNLNFPELRKIGGDFNLRYINLRSISAPKLVSIGKDMTFLDWGSNFVSVDFPALETIGSRFILGIQPNMKNLDGFRSLRRVGSDFIIGRDPWGAVNKPVGITNFCGVSNLFQQGHIGGAVIIESSAYTPSRSDLEQGKCSQ